MLETENSKSDESESYDEFGNLKKKTQAMEESITKKLYQTKNDNIMIKINSDIKNRTKSFFKFMIEQNPNFTDLEKLEEEYKKQIKESFEILNENKIKIQKKVERMAEIERASTNIIAQSAVVDKSSIETHYQQIIEDIKLKIALQEVGNENYIKLKQTLYGNNIYANKRVDILMKQADKINNQYETYKRIELNTQIQSKFQRKVRDGVLRFQFEKEYVYQKDIKDRTSKYNHLDYQVFTIKESTASLTNKLKEIAKLVYNVQEVIDEVDFKNRELSELQKFYKKTFLNAQVKILKLNRSLNVDNEDDIITRFKEESLKYQTFFVNFARLNDNIKSLNIKYTKLEKELADIKEKIIEKNNLEDKQVHQIGKDNKIYEEIGEIKKRKDTLEHIINDKHKIVKRISTLVRGHSQKLSKLFVSNKIRAFVQNDKLMKKSKLFSTVEFKFSDVKTLLSEYLICQKIILFAYYNKRSTILMREQEINTSKQLVIDIYSNNVDKFEYEVDEKIGNIFKIRANFLNRNDFKIFSQNKTEQRAETKKKDEIKAKRITSDVLFKNFLMYYQTYSANNGITPSQNVNNSGGMGMGTSRILGATNINDVSKSSIVSYQALAPLPAKVKSNMNQLIQTYGNSFVVKNTGVSTKNSNKVKLDFSNKNKHLSKDELSNLGRKNTTKKTTLIDNGVAIQEEDELELLFKRKRDASAKSRESFESETKLGLLGVSGINEQPINKNIKRAKKDYQELKDMRENEETKRKKEIDLLLFNLFVRKDNVEHREQLINFATTFSKKHDISVEKEKELLFDKDKNKKSKLADLDLLGVDRGTLTHSTEGNRTPTRSVKSQRSFKVITPREADQILKQDEVNKELKDKLDSEEEDEAEIENKIIGIKDQEEILDTDNKNEDNENENDNIKELEKDIKEKNYNSVNKDNKVNTKNKDLKENKGNSSKEIKFFDEERLNHSMDESIIEIGPPSEDLKKKMDSMRKSNIKLNTKFSNIKTNKTNFDESNLNSSLADSSHINFESKIHNKNKYNTTKVNPTKNNYKKQQDKSLEKHNKTKINDKTDKNEDTSRGRQKLQNMESTDKFKNTDLNIGKQGFQTEKSKNTRQTRFSMDMRNTATLQEKDVYSSGYSNLNSTMKNTSSTTKHIKNNSLGGIGFSQNALPTVLPVILPSVFNMNNFNKFGGMSLAKYHLFKND